MLVSVSLLALVVSAELTFEKAQNRCQGAELDACLALASFYAAPGGPHQDDAKAAGLFQGLCARQDAEACFESGVLTLEGRGAAKDPAKAVQLWDKSCSRGSRKGCTALGNAYLEGQGGKQRLEEGEKLLSDACAREWVPACLRLSRYLISEAEPKARDATRGVWLLSQACLAGDVPSCVKACDARLTGNGVALVEAEALKDCQRACDAKALHGCWGLALLHLHADLPERSPKKAVALLSSSCKAAEPRSCIALGELAEVGGAGVAKSAEVAKDRFTFAHLRLESLCGKTAPAECLLDAELAAQGRARDEDAPATRRLLSERCSPGAVAGCFGLGVAKARGHGGAVDTAGALEAFKLGCAGGSVRACRAAGQALLAGKGGPVDPQEAKRLLTLACDGWDALGCAALAEASGGKKTPEGKALRQKACRHGYGPACR
ncbi:MAG: hypothetical protein AMXMBFR34_03630 [Myxococcaceae bacterium]